MDLDYAEFEELGRVTAKYKSSKSAKVSMRRFRAHFGVPPDVVVCAWELLTESKCLRDRLREVGRTPPNPTHYLWALMSLKQHPTWPVLATALNVDEDTARKWCLLHLEANAELDSEVACGLLLVCLIMLHLFCLIWLSANLQFPHCLLQIVWANRLVGDTLDLALVTVDGTHFRIKNRRNSFTGKHVKRWHSHKFKQAGVSYEVAVCIKTGDIVWIHGPFPAATHDLSIFRYGLKAKLLPHELVLADRGHVGDKKCRTPRNALNCQHKRAMAALRARHETVNRRFKTFGSLQHAFRLNPNLHHTFFRSVAVLIQLSQQNGYSHYDVVGYIDPACEAEWDAGDERSV